MKNLYVFNPDTRSFVPAEQWLEEKDPTRAELVGIETEAGMLVLEKKNLGDHTFEKAQEVAKSFKAEGFEHEFRCPTRREVIDIQDAFDAGLHEIFAAIGGDLLIGDWCWTSERFAEDGWFARRYRAYGAYFFYGTSGTLNNIGVYHARRCQAVTLCRLD